jgi:acetyltransferase-like isoleucine patch superfamily enzyme
MNLLVRNQVKTMIIRLFWYMRYFFYRLAGNSLKTGKKPDIFPHAIIKFINGGSITIGNNCMIEDYAVLSTHSGNISIGDNFAVESFSILYGAGGLTIGNNVIIAANTVIIPANHKFDRLDIPISRQGSRMEGIVIRDDVWVGAGCSILDGVTIGKGCIIGAGSVVNKSISEYSIVAGVPAKVIKSRNEPARDSHEETRNADENEEDRLVNVTGYSPKNGA